jgi:sugar phosphate isomerase/epimerase
MTFGIHNHWWEFEKMEDGQLPFDHMLSCLRPDVFFEIDVYWVRTAGADPAAIVRKAGLRAPLLHIKDGPCVKGQPMTAAGTGTVDIPAVAEASAGTAEAWIVELDNCATDMMEAVRQSHRYITGRGFAKGRA